MSYLDGIFYGWDWLIWLITTSSSLGGLLVSAVVKYTDNIKKTYCQSIAIVGTAIGSVIILNDFVPTVAAIIGMSLVLLSAYVYVISQPKSK
jgi:UDP-sugar transporter A1/2/3